MAKGWDPVTNPIGDSSLPSDRLAYGDNSSKAKERRETRRIKARQKAQKLEEREAIRSARRVEATQKKIDKEHQRRLVSINQMMSDLDQATINALHRQNNRLSDLSKDISKYKYEFESMDEAAQEHEKKRLRTQIENRQEQLDQVEKVLDAQKDSLGIVDKLRTRIFVINAKKDFNEMSRQFRYATEDMQDNMEDLGESIQDQLDKFSNAAMDIGNALNLSAIAHGIEDITQSVRESKIELRKNMTLSDEDLRRFTELTKLISKSSNYAVSMQEAYAGMADINRDMGIDDPEILMQISDSLVKFRNYAPDINYSQFTRLSEVGLANNFDMNELFRDVTSGAMSIQQTSGMRTTSDDFMSMLEDRAPDLAMKYADDQEEFTRRLMQEMALKTAANASGMGDALYDNLIGVAGGDVEAMNAFHKSTGGYGNALDIQNAMMAGDYKGAMDQYVNAMETFINESGITDTSLYANQLAEVLGVEMTAETRLFLSNIKSGNDTYLETFDQASAILQDQNMAMTKSIDQYEGYASGLERTMNKLKSNDFVAGISNTLDELDMTAGDIFIYGSIIGKIGKGLMKIPGISKGVTGLLGKIGLGGAGSTAAGATAGGGGILGTLGSLGASISGGLGSVATGLGSTAAAGTAGAAAVGGAGILGGLFGLIGLGSAGKDIYDAVHSDGAEERKKLGWSGGTKIGMVGTGAAAGAAIGSVVPVLGTAIGALVGAGIGGVAAILTGTKVGAWLSEKWDGLTEGAKNLWSNFTDWGSNAWSSVKEWGSNTWSNISEWGSDTWNDFTQWGSDSWSKVIGYADMGMEGLFSLFGIDWHQFQADASAAWDGIVTKAGEGWDWITTKAGEGWDWISGKAGGAWDWITTKASDSWSWITTKAGEGWDWVSERATNFWTGVTTNISTAWESFKTWGSESLDSLGEWWENSAFKKGIDGVGNFFKDLGGSIKNGWTKFVTGLEELDESALRRGNAIRGIDGSHETGLDRVPTDGYIAELHRDEAVLTAGEANAWRSNNANSWIQFFREQGSLASSTRRNGGGGRSGLSGSSGASLPPTTERLGGGRTGISAGRNGGGGRSSSSISSVDLSGMHVGDIDLGPKLSGKAAHVQDFVRKLLPYALDAHEKTGLLPSIFIAQAGGESGWGLGSEFQDNNLYGITAGGSWQGPTHAKASGLTFRSYESWEESMEDYVTWLQRNNYDVFNSKNYWETLEALNAKGYSGGDGSYYSDLIGRQLIQDMGLDYWDPQYAAGTPMVPEDQIALIHKKEMIVPADMNPANGGYSIPLDDDGGDDGTDEIVAAIQTMTGAIVSAIRENRPVAASQQSRRDRVSMSDQLFNSVAAGWSK